MNKQAVLKFMAGDKCDRQTAMGNMDKYLDNPADWAFNRMEQKKRGIKYDYVTLDQKQVVLVTVWSLLIGFLVGRGIYSYIYHVPYVRFVALFCCCCSCCCCRCCCGCCCCCCYCKAGSK
jgi:hypothetical protein